MNDYFALNSDLELADVGNRKHIFELLAIILFADFCNYEHLSHLHRVAFWKQEICTCYLYKMENGKFIILKVKKTTLFVEPILFYFTLLRKLIWKLAFHPHCFQCFCTKFAFFLYPINNPCS